MTQLLTDRSVWPAITAAIRKSPRSDAAIAYLGTGSSRMLPFKRGDTLVADMGLAALRAGVTNPFEVEKLIAKGVKVFSHPALHAKVLVTTKHVLIGSANASSRSDKVLSEAIVALRDPALRHDATAYIQSIATQPIGPEYLATAKRNYRPPRFAPGRASSDKPRPRIWSVRLEEGYTIPEDVEEWDQKVGREVKKLVSDSAVFDHESFYWPGLPKMSKTLEQGDALILFSLTTTGKVLVHSPVTFLRLSSRRRPSGRIQSLFYYEYPRATSSVSWKRFRQALPLALRPRLRKPRTTSFSESEARLLLSLWTPQGRFRK